MTSMAEFLGSIRLENGKPDMQARRAELESLIHNISLHERRYLKDQLRSYTFQKDICGQLPTELLLYISSYLDLKDLMGARAVSRVWNRAFTSPEMTLAIVKANFGYEWEDLHKHDNPEMQHEHQTLSKWLLRAASRRIRRLQGLYYSRSMHIYGETRPLNRFSWLLSTNPQYCNGRVAYNRDNRSIVVWNLRTNTTTIMMEENRVELHQWKLSEQYIVCWEAQRRSLFAMPLDDVGQNEKNYHISLPSSVSQVHISQDQVAIITRANGIMIWTIRGSLKPLEIGNLPDELAGFIASTTPIIYSVSFHARNKHHISVVYRGSKLSKSENGGHNHHVNIVIQEYMEGKLIATHIFEEPQHAQKTTRFIKLSHLEDSRIADISLLEPDNAMEEYHQREDSVPVIQITAFNFYTHRWSSQSYTISWLNFRTLKLMFNHPNPMPQATEIFWWRDQMLHLNYYDKRLISIADPSLPKWISGPIEWDIDIDTISGPRVNDHGEPIPTMPPRLSIQGDDDFVVCFGDKGYYVWFFEKESEAAKVAPLRRERTVDDS